jgi:DNA-binding MarR family transcriptional regulator
MAGRALGLGRAQQGVLQVLIRNDGIDMKTLAERLEVSQPSATVAVDPLVEKGLVERVRDGNDGRVTRVFLTRRAKGLARRLRAAQLQAAAELLQALSAEEKEILSGLFRKILANK